MTRLENWDLSLTGSGGRAEKVSESLTAHAARGALQSGSNEFHGDGFVSYDSFDWKAQQKITDQDSIANFMRVRAATVL